ncbi:MAG: integrase [Cryomorphaceae bacterium]|nr:MAG: integrase [Cryomorphaceae bacterium]
MSVPAFLNYVTHEKRYSAHTVKAYSSDLDQFGAYLKQSYELDEPGQATHTMIRSWVVELVQEGVKEVSIKRKISCLKAYYKYLKRTGQLTVNPMQKVVAPRAGTRLPVFVEEKNMNRLFEPDMFSDDFTGCRDALIIELFYHTGMRLSELIQLTEKDVRTNERLIRVLGKRNKERLIPISDHLAAIIKRYETLKKEQSFCIPTIYFVVKDNGDKLYPKLVYRIVNHYLGLVTTLRKKSPHVLRHTFATHMLNHGADLGAIRTLLGHSSLAATQVYTHNSIEKLKDVHRKAHPKG